MYKREFIYTAFHRTAMVLALLDALIGSMYFIFRMHSASAITPLGLYNFLLFGCMGFSIFPILYSLLFQKDLFPVIFALLTGAILLLELPRFRDLPILYWIWLAAHGACVSAAIQESQTRKAFRPTVSRPAPVKRGPVLSDHFIVPIRIDTLSDSTRISFAASKDNDWVTNGLIVTLSKDHLIVGLEFISRKYGVGRWSPLGVSTVPWEAPQEGRDKWSASLAQSFIRATLERDHVTDILRLIENPRLRLAIDDCLQGKPVKWDPEYSVTPPHATAYN